MSLFNCSKQMRLKQFEPRYVTMTIYDHQMSCSLLLSSSSFAVWLPACLTLWSEPGTESDFTYLPILFWLSARVLAGASDLTLFGAEENLKITIRPRLHHIMTWLETRGFQNWKTRSSEGLYKTNHLLTWGLFEANFGLDLSEKIDGSRWCGKQDRKDVDWIHANR